MDANIKNLRDALEWLDRDIEGEAVVDGEMSNLNAIRIGFIRNMLKKFPLRNIDPNECFAMGAGALQGSGAEVIAKKQLPASAGRPAAADCALNGVPSPAITFDASGERRVAPKREAPTCCSTETRIVRRRDGVDDLLHHANRGANAEPDAATQNLPTQRRPASPSPAILEARASHGGNGNMDNTEVSYESNPDYRERNMCSRDPSRLHIDGGAGKRRLSPCAVADNRCSAPGKSNSPSSPARRETRPAEIAKRKRAKERAA